MTILFKKKIKMKGSRMKSSFLLFIRKCIFLKMMIAIVIGKAGKTVEGKKKIKNFY